MIAKDKKNTTTFLGFLLFLSPLLGQSQGSMDTSSTTVFYIISGFMFIVLLLILFMLILLLQVLKLINNERRSKKAKESGSPVLQKENWWARFLTKANDAVPVEKEESILLDHDYDGIKELDNHLPPWWTWMFYLSIVFSIVYITVYHITGTLPLQTEEYTTEIRIAEAEMLSRKADLPESTVDENNVQLITDPATLAEGKRVFVNNCAPCHKESGAGGIGPNLTDDYWLHGGSLNDIYQTIKTGVPDKGMISWEPVLSPHQMQNVASFVMGLRGTAPPAAKKPQGELWIPKDTNEEEGQAADTIKAMEAVEAEIQ